MNIVHEYTAISTIYGYLHQITQPVAKRLTDVVGVVFVAVVFMAVHINNSKQSRWASNRTRTALHRMHTSATPCWSWQSIINAWQMHYS